MYNIEQNCELNAPTNEINIYTEYLHHWRRGTSAKVPAPHWFFGALILEHFQKVKMGQDIECTPANLWASLFSSQVYNPTLWGPIDL